MDQRAHRRLREELLARQLPREFIPPGARTDKRTMRILIIDDEVAVRDSCRMVLEDAGFEVETAADGLEGLRRFGERESDLVVCDVYMPGMDGIETIPRLAPLSRIVAISGGGPRQVNLLPLTKRLGADITLAKPFSAGELLEAVHSAFGGEADLRAEA